MYTGTSLGFTLYGNSEISDLPLCHCGVLEEFGSLLLQFSVLSPVFGAFQDGRINLHEPAAHCGDLK